MSKAKTFLSLVGVALLLTGCKFPWQKASPEGSGDQKPTGESVTEKIGSSLKDAFGLGKSMKCTYAAPGGAATTIFVKDKKVRIEGAQFSTNQDLGGGMINDGEWIYIWDNTKKEGMKYQVSALKTVAGDEKVEDGFSMKDWADFGKWVGDNEQKLAMKCDGALLADSQFVPPSDITFQDLTEMFLQIEKMKKTQGVEDENESSGSEEQSGVPSGLSRELLESVRQGVAGAADTSEESPAEETPTE
ncbi:MAG: hypothetical protein Q8N84_02075 [bacterium]|nr:hypothetical protein [bacterium]